MPVVYFDFTQARWDEWWYLFCSTGNPRGPSCWQWDFCQQGWRLLQEHCVSELSVTNSGPFSLDSKNNCFHWKNNGKNTHLRKKSHEKVFGEWGIPSSPPGKSGSAQMVHVSWCAHTSQILVCWEGWITGLDKSCPEAAAGFHLCSSPLMNITEEEMPELVLENKHKGGLE